MPPVGVSIVIPTYKEYTFGDSLDYLGDHLRAHPDWRVEIIVVDDSDDDGFAMLKEAVDARRASLEPQTTIKVLRGPRLGKGAAVRMGALAAREGIVFLIDADIPVFPRFIDVFLERVQRGADIVIGERDPDRYEGNPLRQVLARGLFALQSTVVFHRRLFEDTQCGFKAFRADVLQTLANLQFTEGGMYDLEYLYAATQRRLRVERVRVELRGEVRASRINLFRCIVIDPLEIFYFKGRGMLGYYRRGR
jgi:glycosyltransferase involved in cell wall biosynthesis